MHIDILTKIYKNKKILILGFGKENEQFLKWLLEVVRISPEQICLADKKEFSFIEKYQDIIPQSNFFNGPDYLKSLERDDVEYVFKTPGMWSLLPELEKFREKKGQDRVLSNLVFFVEKFREQIIGVNGTKGKSTTSALINHILNKSKTNAGEQIISYYCGNTTGVSPYQYWTSFEQKVIANQFFVIEMSSFQLQDLGYSKISPSYAVVTNYFIDHQDQHATPEEYWQSKENLFLHQKDEDKIVITDQVLTHTTQPSVLNRAIKIGSEEVTTICSKIKPPLIGFHNQTNLSEALVIVEAVVTSVTEISKLISNILANTDYYQEILNSFQGLSHRLELVRECESKLFLDSGVLIPLKINFYDDGAASEPDAVVAALDALTQEKGTFVWLQISGFDKKPDLDALIDKILEKQISNQIFTVDYCGAVGKRLIEEIYTKLGVPQEVDLENFKDTIGREFSNLESIRLRFEKYYREQIQNYDALGEFQKVAELTLIEKVTLNILLSPSGSSFDEFENYIQRCEWWVGKVKKMI